MRGGDSELFNYLDITLNPNCVQNVFTFFIISKICAMVFRVKKKQGVSNGSAERVIGPN